MGQDASKPAADDGPLPVLNLAGELSVHDELNPPVPAAEQPGAAGAAPASAASSSAPAAAPLLAVGGGADGSTDQLPAMPPVIAGTGGTIIKNLGDYRLEKQVLGEGAFGKVRLATSTRTGHRVAVKVIKRKKLNERAEVLLQREVKHHEKLRHPNIVRLHTFIMTPSKYYLVMEYCEGGDLLHYINASGLLSDELARTLFRGLVDGIRFCHVLGIHHRDLKLENLMLTSCDEARMQLKIADFGLSDLQSLPTTLSSTFCGSPLYAAPELMTTGAAPDGYDAAKSDVWSCGVILYALLASALPFDADDICALVRLIQQGVPNCPLPEQRGPLAGELVAHMLIVDPKRRPTASEVLEHVWATPPEERRGIKSSVTTMSLASIQRSNDANGGDAGGGGDGAGSGGGGPIANAVKSSSMRAAPARRRGASAATRFFKDMMREEMMQEAEMAAVSDAAGALDVSDAADGPVHSSDGGGAPGGGAPSAAMDAAAASDAAPANDDPPPQERAIVSAPASKNASDEQLSEGSGTDTERPKGRVMTRGELQGLKAEAAEQEAKEAAEVVALPSPAAGEEGGVPQLPLAAAGDAEAAPTSGPSSAAASPRGEGAEGSGARRGGAPLTKEEWDEIRRERQIERERRQSAQSTASDAGAPAAS